MLEFLRIKLSKFEGKIKSLPNEYQGVILLLILIVLLLDI